ncbi:hypothetical protein [Nocardioides sp. WS12]|uniref:hypothetical protein n=1 Tax=Nocardioides sp. WS12 TaxID=2486272 RepID=UPI0015FBA31D|nr:hypothetical protein [Nocardioides sp. WS12]
MSAVTVVAGLGVTTFVALYSAPSNQQTLVSVQTTIFMILVIVLICMAPRVIWVRLTAGTPQLNERAPAELVAPLFALPLCTAITGMAIVVPQALAAQIGSLNPEWSQLLGWVSLELAAGAAFVACCVPFLALKSVIDEREGRRGSLFDPSTPEPQFETTMATRWANLRSARRCWLNSTRLRALGDEDGPPAAAWPRAGTDDPTSLIRVAHLLPKACALAVALFVATVMWDLLSKQVSTVPEPTLLIVVIAFGLLQMATASLTLWTIAYATLGSEQGEADLLRRARAERAPLATEPTADPKATLSLGDRLQLIKQAMSASASRRQSRTP